MSEPAISPAALALQLERARDARAPTILGGLVLFASAAAALAWAKWLPYSAKLADVWSTHAWTGKDLLAKAGAAGSDPSVVGAWRFTWAYIGAVWKALVAALVIASAAGALLPRRCPPAAVRRGGRLRGSLLGGVAALPSLMCTCCTAPVAVTLRRAGVPRSTVLAYWLGNPVLNPAVLAFLALVAPWQWAATRIVVGCILVFGVSALIAGLGDRHEETNVPAVPAERPELESATGRFGRTLLRLTVTLLPEYVLVVFLLGLTRGWILPLGAGAAHLGMLAVLIAALLGTLVVIPTGGEIRILLGLSTVGIGSAAVGALLITLPAISLVSMAMVIRTFSARITLAMAGGVAACGVLSGALLWTIA